MPLQNPQDVAAHSALDTGVHGVGGSTVASLVTAGKTKPKLETRAMSAASGDVSYTGYGFQPTGLIIMARVPGQAYASIGASEPALGEQCLRTRGGIIEHEAAIVHLGETPFQQAVVKTYDADGFTLTWTKSGTPDGTGDLHVFAFK
ncbi:unnamed protein product [marine sediment metagenome]|uniref:Uncharacterized protein n=1 Tax=marine sediment metagenome TaxID=412755 RepID=X1LQT9_9ZZZZ